MEKMGFKKCNSTRKPNSMRRRSHTRKAPQSVVINTAEARREIATALQLHRSSTSSSSTSCDARWAVPVPLTIRDGNNIYGDGNGSSSMAHSQRFCSTVLMDTLPLPQPTWSTTAPSVVVTPPPPVEALEFMWFENHASSYAWWLGFLKTLDEKDAELTKYSVEENIGVGSSAMYEQCQDYLKLSSGTNEYQGSALDEWFTNPQGEDQGEMM